jgi:hypothetical protein
MTSPLINGVEIRPEPGSTIISFEGHGIGQSTRAVTVIRALAAHDLRAGVRRFCDFAGA